MQSELQISGKKRYTRFSYFLETLKGFSSPTGELAKRAPYHEEFAFLQVRWPNGHQNTYRYGAEGASDLLVHPAVSPLLFCPSSHPIVRSLVRIFRSYHPYFVHSFISCFFFSKRLDVSNSSLTL